MSNGALVDALLESAHDAMWVVSRELTVTQFNRVFARLCAKAFHRTPVRAGIPLVDIFDDAAGELCVDLCGRALAGRAVSADARFTVEGMSRSFVIGAAAVSDGASVAFTAHDVTEATRRAREDIFELSLTRLFFEGEKPLAATVDSALSYVCQSDEWDGGVTWLVDNSGQALEVASTYGESVREHLTNVRLERGHGLPGRAWQDDDIAWAADLLDETNVSRARLSVRMELHSAVAVPIRDGARVIGAIELLSRSMRPISEVRGRALLRAGADLGRLIARRRDEDERRRLMGIIERKGVEWTVTFDAIELPIFLTAMDGTIRRMNRAARDLAGGSFAGVIGRTLASFGENEPWLTLARCVESMRDSGQPCAAQAYHPVDERWWDIAGNVYRDPEDGSVHAAIAVRETTMIVHLQESVRRGEHLAALGELVAGVAHEVRNPLFGMQITLDALEAVIPDPEPVREFLQAIRGWLDRLNRLMENLLDYGKPWGIDLQKGSVSDVLDEAVKGCRPIADAATVSLEMQKESLPPILMDASRLARAFQNLITNAVQHSPPENRVIIDAKEDAGFVVCAVRDFGPGFADADLSRIFQPFYTKRRGGTGLGLSIVQRIIDEHGGIIRAENAPDGGAIVTIRLPIYTGSGG
jgi:signal transduction histidine kinase